MNLFDQISEAKTFLKKKGAASPRSGIVLGSGLGDFCKKLGNATAIDYAKIPHFRASRVAGHAGRLVLGEFSGKPLAVLQGRYHYYEGHSIQDVVFPVRVLCSLGIETLILTNAAGGIGSDLQPGDLMIIRDHINFMGANPLRGENDDRIGTRFPDMTEVYDKGVIAIISDCMKKLGMAAKTGVYAAVSGPSYETPAEIKMLAVLGADAAGMSTVPEAIAARHMEVKVAGISCITNLAAGLSKTPLTHDEVTRTADQVKDRFQALLTEAVARL
ncbi:MAG: purine-nucleoside phosphorylase [Planctomycetota bacterium]|jgi:purine-nucleoside phosphorylase